MSDQYVFDLKFMTKGGDEYRENQFVIIDGSSMTNFTKLREDLALCFPEPFLVQYIDDEEDIVSIDTEEEFQEFAKIAKKRCSRGMLMRLILNANLPLDHGQYLRHVPQPDVVHENMPNHFQRSGFREVLPPGLQHVPTTRTAHLYDSTRPSRNQHKMDEFKELIKAELKNEILSELKEMAPAAEASAASMNNCNSEAAAGTSKEERMEEEAKEAEYEEDSDGNMFLVYLPEKKRGKLMHHQKKLEKKEKLVEAKIDQRLEKLEMKRKKLMEKYSHHKMLIRRPSVDPKVALPMIISAIATRESSEIKKRVSATKVFTHIWTVVNDGTVTLTNVELRHAWSSPGLEPEEAALKVVQLLPGQEGSVAVRFKAPKTNNCSFVSYWHFFHLVDNNWQEFGHYVSVSGSTKPPKPTPYDFPSESNKKLKQDQRTVKLMETDVCTAFKAAAPKDAEKEKKVLNEESLSNITLKKQMEQLQATLASSEIAAEMAREAARLLAMATVSTEGNTATPEHAAPKPSEGDKLNNCALEEAAAGVQQLNLVDSESDTDANMEINEDSDRGFVIVTMTSEQPSEEPANHVVVSKEDEKQSKEGNNAGPSTDNNAKEEAQAPREPMSFPRLDPNVTYPVFPPPPPRVANAPMYVPHSPMMPNNVFNYPVFPPTQNAPSHGIVFPPPVNYSQIPTYQPIPTFPQAVTLPLTPPTFVSQPPQMASQPSQNMPHIPFTPFNARQPGDKIFWAPLYNEAPAPSTPNSTMAPTEKPAETEAQQLNTAVRTENFAASTPSAESNQPQPQVQPQPQPQAQPQPQQQTGMNSVTGEQNKNAEPVQILPQALVDGAINVAATAYSTAWNALNNLRPKEGEASEFDPVFENNMAMLVEMGFNNLERNARLLKRFHNDISQVIGVICATGGGGHNLDID